MCARLARVHEPSSLDLFFSARSGVAGDLSIVTEQALSPRP
jgi:hypothetical protein